MITKREADAETRRAYNLAAARYDELFHDELIGKAFDRELLDEFAAGFEAGALVLDAGCGPSGHIGRYVADRGVGIVGVDLAERCCELARRRNPALAFVHADMGRLPFPDATFDGVLAYYSIIDTPKAFIGRLFAEFHRVLKPRGLLLAAVKAGAGEGFLPDLLGLPADIYLAYFSEKEMRDHYEQAGFRIERLETRAPYEFEIDVKRIFALGRKDSRS
jgi:ubiquinone/menaquinone biosynthesis C-methylase UbiE